MVIKWESPATVAPTVVVHTALPPAVIHASLTPTIIVHTSLAPTVVHWTLTPAISAHLTSVSPAIVHWALAPTVSTHSALISPATVHSSHTSHSTHSTHSSHTHSHSHTSSHTHSSHSSLDLNADVNCSRSPSLIGQYHIFISYSSRIGHISAQINISFPNKIIIDNILIPYLYIHPSWICNGETECIIPPWLLASLLMCSGLLPLPTQYTNTIRILNNSTSTILENVSVSLVRLADIGFTITCISSSQKYYISINRICYLNELRQSNDSCWVRILKVTVSSKGTLRFQGQTQEFPL